MTTGIAKIRVCDKDASRYRCIKSASTVLPCALPVSTNRVPSCLSLLYSYECLFLLFEQVGYHYLR